MKKKSTIKKCLFTLAFLPLLVFAQPSAPSGQSWVAVTELTDEFNGTSLDGNKWLNYHPYWTGRAPSQYKSDNISVSGGNLKLKASVANRDKSNNWVWGCCVTSKTKAMKVGYYSEARIKCPSLSMTGAYWFQGSNSEIDVIENFGQPSSSQWYYLRNVMQTNTHYFKDGWDKDQNTPWGVTDLSPAVDEAYFTYGVWWKDSKTVVFYLNGEAVHTTTTKGEFNEDLYMFFDMETFDWGIGLPTIESLDDNSKNTQYVDWVHTYKLVNSTSNYPVVSFVKDNAQDYAIDGNNGGIINQQLYLYSYSSSNVNQQWYEISRGDGYYSYQKMNTNYCIDGNEGGANGQAVKLYSCSDDNQNQHWKKIDLGSGKYRLEKRNEPGFSIDGASGGANNQVISLYTSDNNNVNQQWLITSLKSCTIDENIESTPELLDFSISPNSATNEYTIRAKMPEDSSFDLRVYNISGILVYSSNYCKSVNGLLNITVNLSQYPQGLYFIVLNVGGKKYSQKIITT